MAEDRTENTVEQINTRLLSGSQLHSTCPELRAQPHRRILRRKCFNCALIQFEGIPLTLGGMTLGSYAGIKTAIEILAFWNVRNSLFNV